MTTKTYTMIALLAVSTLPTVIRPALAQSPSLQRIVMQEQSEIEKLRSEMRKGELELGAVRADTNGQILSQRVTQAEIKHLRTTLATWDRHVQTTKTFAVRPSGAQKGSVVLLLLRSVRVEKSLAEVIDQSAPPIAAEDFEAHLFRGVVESTGELVALPDCLLEFAERKGHTAKLAALQSQWQVLADELVATGIASASHRQAMQRHLNELRKVAATAVPTIRAQSNLILDRIQKLIIELRHRTECRELADFLEHHGHAFSGGTVDALLEHVVAYSLVPRQGSVPQRLLSKLASVLAQTASDQSLSVRKRLDKLRNNGSFIMPGDEPSRSAASGSVDGGVFPRGDDEELSLNPRREPANRAEQPAASEYVVPPRPRQQLAGLPTKAEINAPLVPLQPQPQ